MGRLDGKVVVITGAGGGIGREAALLFSAEGARVCVADVGRETGEKTAAECRDAFFFQAGDGSRPVRSPSMSIPVFSPSPNCARKSCIRSMPRRSATE